jgi:type VI secretion system protein ImpH
VIEQPRASGVSSAPEVVLDSSPDAPATSPPRLPTLREQLLRVPSRFTFDAAVAVMMRASGHGDPGAAIRFKAAIGLAFAPSDVLAVEESSSGFAAIAGMIGLTGPAGVLPRLYTEMVNTERRRRSDALTSFLDMLAQRPVAQFASAGIKYRPHRVADAAAIGGAETASAPRDGMRDSLLALVGYADPTLLARVQLGADPLLYYAGAFATWPRSVDRLAAVLSDWLGQQVEVEQFSGCWLELGRDQMTALRKDGVGQFNRLGVDAAIGARTWDIQSRITLRVGPLKFSQFQALLPGGALLRQLAALARTFLGDEIGFSINPILAAKEVPLPSLGPAAPCLLGWAGWLPISGGRKLDAIDTKFTATVAERAISRNP